MKKANKNKLLVFDLDETLIHSKELPEKGIKHQLMFNIGDEKYYVYIRPGVYNLLNKIIDNYDLAVYTAATK